MTELIWDGKYDKDGRRAEWPADFVLIGQAVYSALYIKRRFPLR